MVGNPDEPIKPTAKTFNCPSCGAPVTVKYAGFSLSAVCGNCFSVIDVTDNNYQILSEHFAKTSIYKPLLQLGARGKLEGRTWEVIGFCAREDEASHYPWLEYLLFNPYYGYRWLTFDKGHWSFVTTVKDKPETNQRVIRYQTAQYKSKSYKLYNRGNAITTYVLGEFYWRVVVGYKVEMTDYINPPEMLSCERDQSEVVWSVSKYIEPAEIQKGFNLLNTLPRKEGVAPNQISKRTILWGHIWKLYAFFLTVLFCLQVYFVGSSQSSIATTYTNTFIPNTKKSDITLPTFTLEKSIANVQVHINTTCDNSWFYVGGELVNDDNGTTYPFEGTAEYYSGYDSDGYWSEGTNSASIMFNEVPAGRYYINIDTESGSFKDTNPRNYSIQVIRDVATYSNFGWAFFLLSIMPFYAWAAMRQDEVARWSNSDYSPYVSSS